MTITVAPWWAEDAKGKRHERLFTLIRQQQIGQQQRYMTMRRYISTYEYGWRAADRVTAKDKYLDETTLFFNRAQNAVDTIVSLVTAPSITPLAFTEGGSWEERENAKLATRALQGLCQEKDLDGIFEDVCYDAAMCGTGFAKIYAEPETGELCIERVNPLDVFFDEAETRYRQPRCLYHRQFVDRAVAAERWGVPSKALEGSAKRRREAIERAQMASSVDGYEPSDDIIEVIEAWHLPSTPESEVEEAESEEESKREATDGRHTITIDGFDVVDEPWDDPKFPFAMYTPKKPRVGVWGIPLMRQLAAGQRELEALDVKLQRAHRRMGGSHILVHKDAKIAKRTLTNDQGDILEWEGNNAPTEWTPAPANPQTYDYRERVAADMLRFVGSNQLQANGMNPLGANASGRAITTLLDESVRYLGQWFRARNRWTLDVVDLVLDAIEDLVEANPKLAARYVSPGGYQQVPWKQICEMRETLAIRVEPVNATSISAAAKADELFQRLNAQLITPEQFKAQDTMVDLRAEDDVDLADRDIIDKTLAHMVRTGEYISPEPFDNLALIVNRGGKFYNMLRRHNAKDSDLALVRQYILDAQDLLSPPQAPPDGSGAPSPAPPPGPSGGGSPMSGEPPMPPEAGPVPPPDMAMMAAE